MPQIRLEFTVPVEGTPEQPLALRGYLFDGRGRLMAHAPIKDGRLALEAESTLLGRAQLVIAADDPSLPQPSNKEGLRRLGAYEPAVTLKPEVTNYPLKPLPPEIWQRFLLCSCLVRGRVVRPVTVHERVLDLPVCHARVHVCEVDPWPLLIAKIPDPQIVRIRDELLRAAVRRPPRPEPDPGPLRVLRPELLTAARLRLDAPVDIAADIERMNIEALDLAPELLEEVAVTQPELVATMMRGRTAPPIELPQPLRGALESDSAPVLRAALERHIEALLPWMCRWPWIWPLLRKQEIAVIETDAHGRFETRVLYPCRGDHPDIYIWVEYAIGGTWTPVYKRPVACATQWNFACGKEITIRVTDPRVPWCGDPLVLPGTEVGVITVGNAVNTRQIGADGLAPGGRPFGGSLEPTLWFGEGLIAAGVTHYRWSYRRIAEDGAALEGWHALDGFVGRHYGVITPGGALLFKVYKLGPDDAVSTETLFQIPPATPPAGTWAPQINARSNTASGYFLTGRPGEKLVADGLYELKLELFRVAGGVATKATGLDFRMPPAGLAAPFAPDVEIAFEPAPEGNLLRDGGGAVEGFVMRVRVDNSPCIATIYPTAVPASTQECGFISFPATSTTAAVSFVAAHPRGYGDFNFSVIRGSCGVPSAAAVGKTGDSPVGPYALLAGAYRGDLAISGLLGPLAGPPSPCAGSCRRAAFAEHLHVYARATDGWSRLSYLDAHAVVAFALNPAG